jgi:hypothetical protein
MLDRILDRDIQQPNRASRTGPGGPQPAMSVTLLNRDMLIRRKANGTAFTAAAEQPLDELLARRDCC